MEQSVVIFINLHAPEGEREVMTDKICRQVHEKYLDVFGGVTGHFDYYATTYFMATVEADDEATAQRIALDYIAEAVTAAGYEVTPSWSVQVPVSKEEQLARHEEVERFFSQAAA